MPKTFKEYYNDAKDQTFREKMKAYNEEKVECDICMVMIRRSNVARHYETQRHKRNEEKLYGKYKIYSYETEFTIEDLLKQDLKK